METKIIINALRECKKPYTVLLDVSAEMIADRLEELEIQNSLLRAEKKFQKTFYTPQPEWISVEDEPIPGEKYHVFTVLPKIIIKRNPETGEPAYWMRLEPPKPKEPTFKDIFLRAFPKAATYEDGIPKACIDNIFPWATISNCALNGCIKCWTRPYFEEEGGEE